MHDLDAHVRTLTRHATPETTLVAVAAHHIRRFPDVADDDPVLELARADQLALRLLERQTRLALRTPDRDHYHAHHDDTAGDAAREWAVLLAPRGAEARVYLTRASARRFYQMQSHTPPPDATPGTVIASWQPSFHPFTHVTTPRDLHQVLYACTAHEAVHIPIDAPATGQAFPFRSLRSSST